MSLNFFGTSVPLIRKIDERICDVMMRLKYRVFMLTYRSSTSNVYFQLKKGNVLVGTFMSIKDSGE